MEYRIARGVTLEKGFLRRWHMRWVLEDKKETHYQGKLCALCQREWVPSLSHRRASFLLNSWLLLSSVKDQGPVTQKRCILVECRTREDSGIEDAAWRMNMCREDIAERALRYSMRAPIKWGGKMTKEERRTLNPILTSFIIPTSDLSARITVKNVRKKTTRKEESI